MIGQGPTREQGIRELRKCSCFNGRTGDEGEVKACIVHSKELFLKEGFQPHELPALQLFRSQIGNPFLSSRRKQREDLGTPRDYFSLELNGIDRMTKVLHRKKDPRRYPALWVFTRD